MIVDTLFFFTVVALNLKDVLGYTCVNYLFALHVIVSQFCWFDVREIVYTALDV